MQRSKISLIALLLCAATSLHAQDFCNDPEGCNYSPTATTNEFCWYAQYIIPVPGVVVLDANYSRANYQGGGEPAVFFCLNDGSTFPSGYGFANQTCAAEVIANDPFCLDTAWDNFCQNAYESCCPTNEWYLPANPLNTLSGPGIFGAGGGGTPIGPFQPAVLSCSAPEGYVIAANQLCVENVTSTDIYCALVDWDLACQGAYNACNFGCASPIVYLPSDCGVPVVFLQGGIGDGTPAVISCDGPPFGYEEALSQDCALSVIANDPFCLETEWDSICENAYNECISGCTYAFACNYDPTAIVDDGSCGYPGCTDAAALNYDPNAACDNALCIFEESTACAADFNDDGTISVADLLIFLPLFGGACIN